MLRTHPTRRGFLAAALAIPVLSNSACTNHPASGKVRVKVVDDAATAETCSLFAFLKKLQGQGLLFGHQHDISQGSTFEVSDGMSSDTLAAVGDHPGLFGWDTLILEGKQTPGVAGAPPADNEAAFIRALQDAHRLGGISTINAHLPNFVNGTDSWDTTGEVVKRILPGGDKHGSFRAFLDRIARVCRGATADDGTLIPIIFRPWHENNGTWFWWGAEHTSTREYIEIFRFTVEYLRDTCLVHNLLYCYSPAGTGEGDAVEYMRTYPGDPFVDVLGYDRYDETSGSTEFFSSLVRDLQMVVRLADARGKVPAYTEFGSHSKTDQKLTWFTDLLAHIIADPVAKRISYMETWETSNGADHAYVPYPAHDGRNAHPLLPDFQRYAADPYTLFASDIAGVFSVETATVRNAPLMHLVTPTDQQHLAATSTVVRASVTGALSSWVSYSINGGPEAPMTIDDDGYWSATWQFDTNSLKDRSTTLDVTAWLNGRRHTDSALVLLGRPAPLPHGWVDDFEGYAGQNWALSKAYNHIHSVTTALTSVHKVSGSYGLALSYDVGPTGYVGIGKEVGQDWSRYTGLKLWVRGDGSSNGATLQIVADGVHFEHPLTLEERSGKIVTASFSEFGPAPWDDTHSKLLLNASRLKNVSRFNLYIGKGGAQTTGTVYVDDIRAVQ